MSLVPLRVAFLGSKESGKAVLESLLREDMRDYCQVVSVVTEDDRGNSRSLYTEYWQAKATLGHQGRHLENVVADTRADLLVVCGWYAILPMRVVNAPRLGSLAVHYSFLPKYRGGSPLAWQIINGEPAVGLSVFKMDEGMDSGPVYTRTMEPIGQNDYASDLRTRLDERAASQVASVVRLLADGVAVCHPQDEAYASYCGQRAPADGNVDWRAWAGQVERFIRAHERETPAYTLQGHERLGILRAWQHTGSCHGTPGQTVMSRSDGAVLVACGHGTGLWVGDVLHRGAVRPAKDVIGSNRTRLGPPW